MFYGLVCHACVQDQDASPNYLSQGLRAYMDPKTMGQLSSSSSGHRQLETELQLVQQRIDAIIKQGEALEELVQRSRDSQ